jgi:hypothetical protein
LFRECRARRRLPAAGSSNRVSTNPPQALTCRR